MPTVCVGPELGTDDDGRLIIKICGDPADQVWPFPCPTADGNPLRKDPACGLWVPPYPGLSVVTAAGNTAVVNQLVPAAVTEIESADITINNPSDCHEALVLQFVHADVDWNLPPNADATIAVRVDSNEFLRANNTAPAGGTFWQGHMEFVQPDFGAAVIPAGGAANFSHPIEVGGGTGGARWTQARWQIKALIFTGMT